MNLAILKFVEPSGPNLKPMNQVNLFQLSFFLYTGNKQSIVLRTAQGIGLIFRREPWDDTGMHA